MASILVVDDSLLVRRMIEKLLRDAGFQVSLATSAESAFELAIREPPSAVVSDLRMSGLSGIHLCRLLRAEPATHTIPVVLLTASLDRRSQFWAQSAGAQVYLAKTDLSKLASVLQQMLLTPLRLPSSPLLEPLSGGPLQRLTQILDGALFSSVIAEKIRLLARYEVAAEFFAAFASLASEILSFHWIALLREDQKGFFVSGTAVTNTMRAEIRSILSSANIQRPPGREQQGGGGDRREILFQEIFLDSRLLARVALAPRHRGIPLEENTFLDVVTRELPLVLRTLELAEEIRKIQGNTTISP